MIKRRLIRSVFLFIDALNECNEQEVRKVVEFLETLSIIATDADVALNICLFSRYYPHITVKKKLELIVKEEKEHEEDIRIYVQDKLTIRDVEIERGILEKASGIFMWVILVVAMLNRAYDDGHLEAMFPHRLVRRQRRSSS